MQRKRRMVYLKLNKNEFMKKVLFAFLLAMAVLPSTMAQRPNNIGTYKYYCSRDAYGDVVEDSPYPNMVMAVIVSTNFFGIAQTGLSYSEQGVTGIWPSVGMDFSYVGVHNGWYIFKQDLGMMGTSLIYVDTSYSRMRVKMSYYEGKYREYKRWDESDDIDYSPTE